MNLPAFLRRRRAPEPAASPARPQTFSAADYYVQTKIELCEAEGLLGMKIQVGDRRWVTVCRLFDPLEAQALAMELRAALDIAGHRRDARALSRADLRARDGAVAVQQAEWDLTNNTPGSAMHVRCQEASRVLEILRHG